MSRTINNIVEVESIKYEISVDDGNGYAHIPMTLGQEKGDLVGFAGKGAPIRIPKGTDGNVLVADSTQDAGVKWATGGGGGGEAGIELTNISGATIQAGMICKLSGGSQSVVLANAWDAEHLLVAVENINNGEEGKFAVVGAKTSILCKNGTYNQGDKISVSMTSGIGTNKDNTDTIGTVTKDVTVTNSLGLVPCLLLDNAVNYLSFTNTTGNTLQKGTVMEFTTDGGCKVCIEQKRYGGVVTNEYVVNAGKGLLAYQPSTVADVLCGEDKIDKGDWIVMDDDIQTPTYGDGYGIGVALESKEEGSSGLVSTLLTLTHEGTDIQRIPKEYQEVEYLEATGKQYIENGVVYSRGINAICDFEFTDTIANFQSIFGAGTTGSNVVQQGLVFKNDLTMFYIYAGGIGNYGYTKTVNTGERHQIETVISMCYPSHYAIFDNEEMSGTASGSPTSTNFTLPLWLLSFKNHPERGAHIKLYGLKFFQKDTNKIVQDFIPCYRKEDNKPGLYDRVNDVFYANGGTEEDFLVGADVNYRRAEW